MTNLNSPPAVIDRETGSLSRAGRIAANAILIGLWLWLYRPVFDYLTIIFSREDFRTNQLVLIGVIGLIAMQIRQARLRPRLDAAPRLYLPALSLALGGSMLYLAVERFLDVNTLSAALFTLASYGLLGLWLSLQRWRQGLPAALLLMGTLPFGDHMQTFIGYPMRILTAAIVGDGLATAGVASLGVDTILVLENSVAQVDLPCSGVKSLWTGMLFLIAATWLEGRPLNLRWLLIALTFAGLLFTANLARVGVLVVVGQVAGWRLAAEMLHVPLGVLGFAAACAAAVFLLRLSPPARARISPKKIGSQATGVRPPQPPTGGSRGQGSDFTRPRAPIRADFSRLYRRVPPGGRLGGPTSPAQRPGRRHQNRSHKKPTSISPPLPCSPAPLLPCSPAPPLPYSLWLTPALAAVILAMALLYTPRPQTGLAQPPPDWNFPGELVAEPLPLKADEFKWLTRDGAESADRRRFEWRGLTGSMILITSTTWRAHHRPERCFEVYGLSLDDSRAHLVNPDFPLRLVSLGDGAGTNLLSAAYWFQSADHTTDDYATRIWADLAPERERWVLVSILFDDAHDPGAADIQALYTMLHETVQRHLEATT